MWTIWEILGGFLAFGFVILMGSLLTIGIHSTYENRILEEKFCIENSGEYHWTDEECWVIEEDNAYPKSIKCLYDKCYWVKE